MARRKRTGKATARRRKRRAPRLRKAKGPRDRGGSGQDLKARISELTKELRQRTDDLSEALDQQTATSEVLKVISSSPGELAPVFQAMLENATRLCEAKFGFVFQVKDGVAVPVAMLGVPEPIVDLIRRGRLRPTKNAPIMRAARTKQIVHVLDLSKEQAYLERDEMVVSGVEVVGIRTLLVTPMIKNDEFIGSITMFRQEVRPFTEKQIELAANFAAQAVIAIDNTRLLGELRESLQQQTATADVLKVISSSPGELEPVFEAILANATRICAAKFGILWLREGDAYRLGALHGAPPAFAETRRREPVIHPGPQTGLGRIAMTKRVVHIADVTVDKAYAERDPLRVALVEQAGARTFVLVPMLKEGELIGAIAIYRQEVRPFTDKQVELVKNFAAQAVIAIENARLLNELRQRTDDLTESLEQQTVTAEILQTINSSPGDLAPVFDAMVESAMRFCQADYGHVYSYDGEFFHLVAAHGEPRYVDWIRQTGPRPPENSLTLERIMSGAPFVHIANIGEDAAYRSGNLRARTIVDQYDIHTMLTVALRKEDAVLGAFVLYRRVARSFSEKQIELVQNFAAQAVIAMENARLLGELRESLQQQTATADVLKVISRSAFDLQAVLNALIETATRMCDADQGAITREIDGAFFRAASYGYSPELSDFIHNTPVQMDRSSIAGRALVEGRIEQILDVKADPEYTFSPALDLGEFRTALGVPMLREGVPIGALTLTRKDVLPFTDKQIELAATFADQAAIAIENVRLFQNVETRTRELAASLEDLRATQDRLVQTQKLASLGQLTAGIAHEIKNPLNFVNNFSSLSSELIDELRDTLESMLPDAEARAEISELTDTLRGNLDKVVQHGKRADTIVKNMLLHSREGAGEPRRVDINAMVEESLNLAYHGARAEKQGFNITLERSFDPAAGEADLFPQEITRVLLNLISNGFYAATKRKERSGGDGREPTLAAATRNLGDRVEISIRDNGTGIAPDVREKMFNPFFTTKPAGEGTGLGLSISHDIVVKQHSGAIEVDTQPGEFTEIRLILPRNASFARI